MLNKLFETRVYVRVLKNRFEVTNVSDGTGPEVVVSDEPFTTTRLLVGEFSPAETCLRRALERVVSTGIVKPRPTLLIHPSEMAEGGLSEVEKRLFTELALGAGARKAVLWVGEKLTPEQANAEIEKA